SGGNNGSRGGVGSGRSCRYCCGSRRWQGWRGWRNFEHGAVVRLSASSLLDLQFPKLAAPHRPRRRSELRGDSVDDRLGLNRPRSRRTSLGAIGELPTVVGLSLCGSAGRTKVAHAKVGTVDGGICCPAAAAAVGGRQFVTVGRVSLFLWRARGIFDLVRSALYLGSGLSPLIHSSLSPGTRRQVLPRCHVRLR